VRSAIPPVSSSPPLDLPSVLPSLVSQSSVGLPLLAVRGIITFVAAGFFPLFLGRASVLPTRFPSGAYP